MTVSVLWLFFTVPWVGLQIVIVVFLDHTYLLFSNDMKYHMTYNILSTKSRGYWDIKNLEIKILIRHINYFVFGYSNM